MKWFVVVCWKMGNEGREKISWIWWHAMENIELQVRKHMSKSFNIINMPFKQCDKNVVIFQSTSPINAGTWDLWAGKWKIYYYYLCAVILRSQVHSNSFPLFLHHHHHNCHSNQIRSKALLCFSSTFFCCWLNAIGNRY